MYICVLWNNLFVNNCMLINRYIECVVWFVKYINKMIDSY